MLSFIRLSRATSHMMFPRLYGSSQAIVIAPMMPSCRPAVASVRRPPPKKNAVGIMCSPHLGPRDRFHPKVPRALERLDRLVARPQGRVEALVVARVREHRPARR